MKRRTLGLALVSGLAFPLTSCDSVDVGRDPDPDGPFRVARILFQEGNRGIASDALNSGDLRACSDINPCPAEMQVACEIPSGATEGVCPDSLSTKVHPPPLADPGDPSGFQIRIVFDRILKADAIEEDDPAGTPALPRQRLKDMAIFQVLAPDGTEVAGTKYYDPAGGSIITSSVFDLPYGPALVIIPDAPLAGGTTYTIKLKTDALLSAKGLTLAAEQASFSIKTESIYPAATNPETAAVTTKDAIELALNGTVTGTNAVNSSVVKRGTTSVRTRTCVSTAEPWKVIIAPVDAAGAPTTWTEGEYTAELSSLKGDGGAQDSVKSDAFGTASTLSFTVTATTADPANPIEDALAACE